MQIPTIYTLYYLYLFVLTVVLSQILSRCFRDHTPGFRAMNIWQNCFRGAFPVFGKFIRSKQPVIHIYDIMHRYLKSVNQPLSRSFRGGLWPFGLCQAFAQLSRAGFYLSRALPSLSPSKALYRRVFERCSRVQHTFKDMSGNCFIPVVSTSSLTR